MSRSKKAGFVPSYRLHKPSGQARVIIDREHIYLGPYGSPASHERYARLIAERAVTGQNGQAKRKSRANGTPPPIGNSDLQICELTVAYMKFAQGYYVKDSEKGKECTEIRLASRPLLQLYTNEKARNFGPLALKAVRQYMVESDLSRGVVNHRVNKIKQMFKWAVSEQLVPSSVYEGLRTVTGLLYGRTTARETEPIKPVEKQWVDAILPYVWPPVAAMIQLQWLSPTGLSKRTRSGRSSRKCLIGARYKSGTAGQPKFGSNTTLKRHRLPWDTRTRTSPRSMPNGIWR